ncbi:hypothetical protein GEMRC1_012573 [Eukaryota sp. GEM-RC1]
MSNFPLSSEELLMVCHDVTSTIEEVLKSTNIQISAIGDVFSELQRATLNHDDNTLLDNLKYCSNTKQLLTFEINSLNTKNSSSNRFVIDTTSCLSSLKFLFNITFYSLLGDSSEYILKIDEKMTNFIESASCPEIVNILDLDLDPHDSLSLSRIPIDDMMAAVKASFSLKQLFNSEIFPVIDEVTELFDIILVDTNPLVKSESQLFEKFQKLLQTFVFKKNKMSSIIEQISSIFSLSKPIVFRNSQTILSKLADSITQLEKIQSFQNPAIYSSSYGSSLTRIVDSYLALPKWFFLENSGLDSQISLDSGLETILNLESQISNIVSNFDEVEFFPKFSKALPFSNSTMDFLA